MRIRWGGVYLLLAAVVLDSGGAAHAASLRWARRLSGCEPPAVFYSPQHRRGRAPCCPLVEGTCAGGVVCPADGICPGEDVPCTPVSLTARPNVILILADDQGSTHFGAAGESRSSRTGTPVPPPPTPNLDLLSGYGTTFTIAHNTASWCFPSINSILTGRYQRSFERQSRFGEVFATISRSMRSLGDDPSAPDDPYGAGNRVGGYCTFLGGKFSGAVGDHGFDALAPGRKLGRTLCEAGPPGEPPRCGSETAATYQPTKSFDIEELFTFLESLLYRAPESATAEFHVQRFFAWYAPRVPHVPLRAPAPIGAYLFGSSGPLGLGGRMNLAQYCNGSNCPPAVTAFTEFASAGLLSEFYGNMWWLDDGVRQIRHYLAMAGAPHCLDQDGQGRYDVTDPAACQGTWAEQVTPDLARNTILIHMSDNGGFLPNSKHAFTENGYRTRLIVYDPRRLPTAPGWDWQQEAIPPPRETTALAHSTDILPTVLGFALGSASGAHLCPVGDDGTPCDGKDLGPHLLDAAGVAAAPPSALRHAMCGHHTEKGTSPTKLRYLLTRPGSVGRCTNLDAPACTSEAECAGGATCLGGHCLGSDEPTCNGTAQCPVGAFCLDRRCRVAPSCIDDAGCQEMFPGANTACVEPETRWCRNAPGVRCSTADDCPVCPAGPGPTPPPCARLCESRLLKLYVLPGTNAAPVARLELTDLFLDPDEKKLHKGQPGSLIYDLSLETGPYAGTMHKLNCCVDDWWPEIAASHGTQCQGTCPADFVCNQ